MATTEVKVWDPLVRVFHWTLVIAFFTAYFTEEDLLQVHTLAGYTVLGLIAVRFVWGLVGTRYARFSSFVFRPGTVIAYVKDVVALRARRYLGHNPAGGAMVVLLLVSLLVTTFSGMAIYAAEHQA
ncbi:MAG: cytochrome b/b6 domain-containing protein, partial [Gammaproteobacteria bacterium]